MQMFTRVAAAGLLLMSFDAGAQHATAFDIEDGERAFENVCANCHGPDGDLIAGIDLGRGIFRRPLSDDQIVDIIINGIENTPMPPTPSMTEPQAREIVAYLRATAAARPSSALAGDAQRGARLYADSDCAQCHAINGAGSRTGPDLTRIGLLRRTAELEIALLEPNAVVQPANRGYQVVTGDGESIVGRLLNHDTFTVQLIDEDERLRSFDKADLREFGFADSTMRSYRDEFDAQQLADLVSYLTTLRGIDQ